MKLQYRQKEKRSNKKKNPNVQNWRKNDGKIKEIRLIINIKNPPIFGADKLAHLVKQKLYIHTKKRR